MARRIQVDIVRAFVKGDEGGNPAGVVLDGGDDLAPEQRQAVAAEVGLSETAFVLGSQAADIKLEFYTPTRRIPHCGHATVAAVWRLADAGRLGVGEAANETVDGLRRVRVDGEGRAFLEQPPARLEPLDDGLVGAILKSLALPPDALLQGERPMLALNGIATIPIALSDVRWLRSMVPDLQQVEAVTRIFDAVCYYPFVLTGASREHAALSRMFGPGYGIPEEAATGMGAGAFACWLEARRASRADALTVEQGRFMTPSAPSLLHVRLEREGGSLRGLWVGGAARAVATRSIALA